SFACESLAKAVPCRRLDCDRMALDHGGCRAQRLRRGGSIDEFGKQCQQISRARPASEGIDETVRMNKRTARRPVTAQPGVRLARILGRRGRCAVRRAGRESWQSLKLRTTGIRGWKT